MALPLQEVKSEREDDLEEGEDLVRRYVPLCRLYSATPRCVMSKKVKARKMLLLDDDDDVVDHQHPGANQNQPFSNKPPLIHFYSRRCRKRARQTPNPYPVFDSYLSKLSCSKTTELPASAAAAAVVVKVEQIKVEEESRVLTKKRKRRSTELTNLGIDSNALIHLDGPRSRDLRSSSNPRRCTRQNSSVALVPNNGARNKMSNSSATRSNRFKKWVRLKFDVIDPKKFVGLQCKVYWPLDADWYSGCVVEYDSESGQHHVEYEDGEVETLTLSNERVKFYISPEEIRALRLSYAIQHSDADDLDTNEMIVLAASLDDSHGIETGDITWAKLTGHAVWPAIVLDESLVNVRKGLSKISGENSFLVQFFGTHDFARVKMKQVMSFLKGLLSSYHLKCKKPDFIRSMEEAKMYLSKQKLPKRMLNLRNGVGAACESESEEDEECGGSSNKSSGDEGVQRKLQCFPGCPLKIGDLEVLRLGKIVKNLEGFKDDKFLWPLGYRAVRKFVSLTDPSVHTLYKMEVLRDDDSKTRPLFRVTTDDGDQFNGSSPSACWNKVYRRLRKIQFGGTDYLKAECASARTFRSGSDMFGFSEPEVLKLIQETSDLKLPSRFSGLIFGRCEEMPVNYTPVYVDRKDLDKCNVCHMDEEYANNLFLQCDKCRMMVHARCYGELEPADGVLWLCNLCRPGAPELPPPCCLCPVIGGAMKPTTDGRWAHLACAMWIPETCLSDIKRMEPIDGLSRVSKDRWKLLCSICGVSYGACIQCSNRTCYVAYHPLCARAAGFCAELADLDILHMIPMDEDEDNQCIRLVSFCKKHSPIPSIGCSIADERIGRMPNQYADTPPINPSGCARCEPYNHLGRRGRKEPEVLAAASLKRAFVENRPYLVSGHCQHQSLGLEKLKHLQHDACNDACRNIVSMAEKYKYMRRTFRKRLAFGKSAIHGFGIFAKFPHKAGDMVIEYTGELVRPPIADRREHQIYNSLVGAGTYMFRIDDERVIDATRAGSIAHLINHSCEPNCYSRVISVNGDEHIIIFAKRDIKQWEELTYDYRFFSIDEQLSCYCGFPSCRGVVNDVEAEAQVSKLFVPRSELTDWRG